LIEDRLKIAVFVDFDNIEIGVKSTLNRHFDIGAVLEAIKERGEVVTKVAYGDWKRAGEHSRSMTQHAIQMVQRNLTPGGDKNGADINLALDALEMAFTRNHINAFVIVGGDSDFIALVEKLKQYDKKVLVVGGRAFTSTILQKNCHEFIAYENLIAPQSVQRRPAERTRVVTDINLPKALPLVRRALKVLADREVSPQLGLLKSTLLQLDSTFSERDYNANTFRDFIEKMAAAGFVKLKQVDRSLLVELTEQHDEEEPAKEGTPAPPLPVAMASEEQPQTAQQPLPSAPPPPIVMPQPSAGPTAAQMEEGVQAMREAFQNARVQPHWPMYLRNVKQFIKNVAPSFDERRFGFQSFLDAVRSGQRAGVFRLERNRQGILRVFAGPQLSQPQKISMPDVEHEPSMIEAPIVVEEQAAVDQVETPAEMADNREDESADMDAQEMNVAPPPAEEQKVVRKRRASPGLKRKTVAPRTKPAAPAPPKRPRKKAGPPVPEQPPD
jgi:uncharacterized protein (TIGR00288 family)